MARDYHVYVNDFIGTTTGLWFTYNPDNFSPTDAQVCAAAARPDEPTSFGPSSTIGSKNFTDFTGDFVLSGGNPEDGTYASVNDLPAGFTPVTATVSVNANSLGGSSTGRLRTASGLDTGAVALGAVLSVPYVTIPTAIELSTEEIIIDIAIAIAGGIQLGPPFIFGTYELVNFDYELDPEDGSDVSIGELITITSSGVNALLLNQLTLTMGGEAITPIAQTANLLTFLVPSIGGSSPIVATGNGVQFSSNLTLGTLNVLIEDASGIYTIVPGKSNDTIYDRNTPGDTFDVEIPQPFVKTGFIGG